MQIKKSKFHLWIVMLLSVVVLAACTTGESSLQDNKESNKSEANSGATLDPNNPTKITFYSYNLALPTLKPGMEKLINDFNETVGKEKGVIVEGFPDQTYQQFKADIAAGKPVDVIQHIFPTLDETKETVGLKAYEDVFPQEELEEHLEGIEPNALELGKLDGKIYGLAFTISTPIVFINGQLFEEAGLDPTDPPETWEEIKEYSLKIKEATGKDGFGLAPDNIWIPEGIIYSNGGSILSEDRTEAQFAGEDAVEAIEMWKDLYANGAHAVGSEEELAEQFMAGNLGMFLSSTGLYSGIKQASEAGGWEVYGAGMPRFGSKAAVPVNSGSALVVRPDSPEKTLAVWEFIKYVTSEEGYTTITSEIGYLPLRTEIADDPNYLKGFIDENPLYRINLEQLSNIKPATIWPAAYATESSQIFWDAIVKSITTDADVRETLQEAEDQINSLLK